MPDLTALFDACERALADAARTTDVCGIDVGFPESVHCRDFASMAPGLRVHTSRASPAGKSAPRSASSPADAVFSTAAGYASGIATATPESLPDVTFGDRRSRHRPPLPGTSIARDGNSRAGTLGLIVRQRRRDAGDAYGLSCAHVLRPVSAGRSAHVSQPPSSGADDVLGIAHARIDNACGDAAIFRITPGEPVVAAPQFNTTVRITGTAYAQLGAKVSKSGVATGVTHGCVDGIGHYRMTPEGPFMRGFRIRRLDGDTRPLSGVEDSGAVWYLSDQPIAVGLHTGNDGTGGGRFAIASHLPSVLEALDVQLW